MTHLAQFSKTAFVIGAPLALAVLEVFHPHPYDLLNLPVQRWMVVHYAQIVLFPLVALAEVVLIRGVAGYAAGLCRSAMFVFAVSYVAFDTAAGVVTGVLVQAAHTRGVVEAWRDPVLAVWNHPIVGGSSNGAPALAVIGTMAWLIGGLAASVALRLVGYSWLPVALLVISAFGLIVFRSHAWPGGPVTFGALATAASVVEWQRRVILIED
jgi:hypothetical protein